MRFQIHLHFSDQRRIFNGGEEEERDSIKDLKRHGRLAVAWDQHGSPVPRWTLTRYGLDNTPTLLALHSTGHPPPPSRERAHHEAYSSAARRSREVRGQRLATTSFPVKPFSSSSSSSSSSSTGKTGRPSHSGVNHHPQLERTEHPGAPLRVLPNYSEKKQGIEPHAVTRWPWPLVPPGVAC